MDGTIIIVWSGAAACMAAIVAWELAPVVRNRLRIRRRLRQLTRA